MGVSTIRKRRTRQLFNSIENGNAYEELKQLTSMPSHRQLLLNSIFAAVEPELTQAKRDIIFVYEMVEKDIEVESHQMETVELQLKKSLKKVDRMYTKVLNSRAQNQGFASSSKVIDNYCSCVQKLHKFTNDIDATIHNVLINISKVDASLPKKSRLLNEEQFNEKHYPLLFDLMHEEFPQIFSKQSLVEHPEPEIQENREESQITSNSNSRSASSRLSSGGTGPKEDRLEQATGVEDIITRYRISQSRNRVKAAVTTAENVYLPPSLRRTSSPSTSTTFKNISASDIIKRAPS